MNKIEIGISMVVIIAIIFFAVIGLEVTIFCEREIVYLNNVSNEMILRSYTCN